VRAYAKALTGAAVAGLTALGTALDDGAVTTGEWVVVAIAAIGVVWAVPNRPPADPTRDYLARRS